MGYSSRYHAASLAAVFLALAIGILIGVGFGDEVVSGTSRSLEESLQDDLADARSQTEELGVQLDREREFGESAYPALVGDRLDRERVAVIAIGGLAEDLSEDIEAALGPTGGSLAKVAVVRYPPETGQLADLLEGTRFSRLDRRPELIEDLGRVAGRQLVTGGRLLSEIGERFLSRFSGSAGRVDDVVLVRDVAEDGSPAEREAAERLESGLLDGVRDAGVPVVAVERSDSEESSVSLFESHDIPTVDNLDLVSGRVAMVFVLGGAEGNFGVKETADQLLPDLLVPAPDRGQ
jgi:hypothetical protein